MIAFDTSIGIKRPAEEVFAYVCDPRNLPAWNSAVQAVRPTSPATNGVGSTFSMKRELPTGPAMNQLEVLASKPPREFTIRTTAGPTPFLSRYRFAAHNGETVVQLDAQVELGGVATRLPQLARRAVKKGSMTTSATPRWFWRSAAQRGNSRPAAAHTTIPKTTPIQIGDEELLTTVVDWGEVTAIATSLLAIGLLGGIGAAVFAAQQAREARRSREAQMAAEFFRLMERGRTRGGASNGPTVQVTRQTMRGVYCLPVCRCRRRLVLYRELDYFEQLAALESQGAFDLELIKLLLGRTLIERWELWRPAIHQAHGAGTYPMFENLVEKLRRVLDDPAAPAQR